MSSERIQERVALLEALYWKNHTEKIPIDVFKSLIKNGYMIQNYCGGYKWSEEAERIAKKFDVDFGYKTFPKYCCQKCGKPIGYLGRFIEWIFCGLIKHDCY